MRSPNTSESPLQLTTTTTTPLSLLCRFQSQDWAFRMSSFRCSICLDTLNATSKPMTTLCGHIYCLDCATFRFSAHPSCAICRKQQTLDKMIRLYPDWENEETRRDTCGSHPDDTLSSSPISVHTMDRAAEDAVETVKQSIADKVEPEDALMVYVSSPFVDVLDLTVVAAAIRS